MRRIDVFGVGLGVAVGGGIVYAILQAAGIDSTNAGIWTQAVLVAGLIAWLVTYVFRATTGTMTYHHQRQEYEEAVLQKRLEAMTPEDLAKLQAEIAAEEAETPKSQHP